MKIQVNSDKTIAVDASLTRFVEREVTRVLDRFARKITRVEIHLSDVDNRKTGQADKRCLVEARPAGARPRTASAKTTTMASAVVEALGKMQRSLATFYGRNGRAASTPLSRTANPPAKKTMAKKAVAKKSPKTATAAKTTPSPEPAETNSRSAKKKRIYQARRKAWPAR
ncbi:MAG: HPF/RaiA family ribosome-associated protein [Bryobacteraceae bacterium]